MTHRTQHDIKDILTHAEHIAHRLPTWLEHHARLLAILDGYSAGTDTPKVKGGGDTLTPVERAAHERNNLHNKLADITAEIDAARLILRNLRNTLEHNTTINTTIPVPRCTSDGRQGAIEWADPTCTNIPSRGPLCDRCAKREYRWRDERGLPPRTNGVYSAAGHVPPQHAGTTPL